MMIEIVMGFAGGILATLASRVSSTWWNLKSNLHNEMDTTRYKQLIEKIYGQLYGQELLTLDEYDELHHLMNVKRRFHHSWFGTLKTNTALREIRSIIREELEESRLNIGMFMDQWMDELKKTVIHTPAPYESTKKE